MIKTKKIKNRAKRNLFLLFLIIPSTLFSQETFSWNDLVSWNGVTHWTKYMIVSPENFGPNALPIPELKTGLILEKAFFECLQENHFSTGDNTNNLYLRYYQPFAKNRIAIEFYMVPMEYYKITSEIRDKRNIRNEQPKGFAVGDLVFGTTIQIVKNKPRFPDLTLEMFCRTTSGGKLDDARFTDHPGYYFNLNFGKNISYFPKLDKLRWYASLGFYNWQTNLDNYLQNDAPSFGLGFQINKNNYEFHNQLCGYWGYISYKDEPIVQHSENQIIYSGDQPVVYRFVMLKKYNDFNLKFKFQKGLHNFDYNSFSVGFQYLLNN